MAVAGNWCPWIFLLVSVTQIGGTSVWEEMMDKPNLCLTTTCGRGQDYCECYLTIEHRLTIIDYNLKTLVKAREGQLYRYDYPHVPITNPNVLTADGNNSRIVIAVNHQFPGPTIRGHEDQTSVIHVRNLMHTDSTTIHWHRMHQQGSTYADGVAMITQCPIGYGQRFTYKGGGAWRPTPDSYFMYDIMID